MVSYQITPPYVTPIHVEGKKLYTVIDPESPRPYSIWLRDSQVKVKQLAYQKAGKILRGQGIKPLPVQAIEITEKPLVEDKPRIALRNSTHTKSFEQSRYHKKIIICRNTGEFFTGIIDAATKMDLPIAILYRHLVAGGAQVRTYTFRPATKSEIKSGQMEGDLVPFTMPQLVPVFVESCQQWFPSNNLAAYHLNSNRHNFKYLLKTGEARHATGEEIRSIDFDKLFSKK